MGAVWMRRMKMAKCGAAYLRVVCRVPAMANTSFAVCQIVGTLQKKILISFSLYVLRVSSLKKQKKAFAKC
jgi:hypothetical protein